jgi:hypothetical protein
MKQISNYLINEEIKEYYLNNKTNIGFQFVFLDFHDIMINNSLIKHTQVIVNNNICIIRTNSKTNLLYLDGDILGLKIYGFKFHNMKTQKYNSDVISLKTLIKQTSIMNFVV